ncbi:MAG: GDP-L-fucose synthase [Proteobacteria bacterium]|nr:GDP-L-fucose synthase [Pseudomonadota bacterium]
MSNYTVKILHPEDKIFVSGHRGMVGSAVCRTLAQQGYNNIIFAGRDELDLTNQQAVFDFFAVHKPQAQVICAAVVGGIIANDTFPADFIGQNLMIQTNLLEAARRFDCAKTVFMASGCIYPRLSKQPIREEQLLTGALESTNQWYAVAKLAGIKMGQAYRRQYGLDMVSVLPANLYGTGDSFDLENSHVIPGLMRRFHIAKMEQAKQVTVWGSGRAMREFMHVDDLAAATVFLMQQAQVEEIINIGYGEDMTIAELAQLMKTTVGFSGELCFDASRPDGTPRKLLDSSHLFALGWRPTIPLTQGLAATYHWFVENIETLREVNPQAWQQ